MAYKLDTLTIEILEDGTIKTSSDAVSQANHANAEEFLRYIARMTAGDSTRTRRVDVNQRLHVYEHEHGPHTHEH